ncbi:MAG: metallophosphoesterase, partial [Pseudomonadales bacterium]|nr:metallophosphoesterase [Pseudomonadales bacterium]
MSTYVIGDVQGCFTELQQLLGAIAFDESQDELWFAGDLINRGPDSLACVEFIMASERCKTVLGNHDLHFLAVALGAQKPGRSDTLDELLASPRL